LTLIVFELGWRLPSRLLLLFEIPPKRHGVAVVHDGTTVRNSNNRLWIACTCRLRFRIVLVPIDDGRFGRLTIVN